MELWDSDRSTADDVVGKVELSMQKMIQHPRKMYPQVSQLQGLEAESSMPGKLHWEVGFFGKPFFRPALRTDGKNPNLPDGLKDKAEFQDDKGLTDTPEADAVAHTPPDPLWPSGVCSVIVHQIVNLELENIKGSQGNRRGREYEPAKEAGEIRQEEGGKLPSSYCTILYNDELVSTLISRPRKRRRNRSVTKYIASLGIPYPYEGGQQQAYLQRRYRTFRTRLEIRHRYCHGPRSEDEAA